MSPTIDSRPAQGAVEQRRKLLVLTPRFPFPLLSGDTIRIYQVCSALARDSELTLLSICQTRQELDQQLPPGNPFSSVVRVYLPRWRSYLNVLLALVTKEPLQLAYYRSAQFARAVQNVGYGHDAVLCHLLRMAPYAAKFVGRKILELTDHLPLTYQRVRALNGSRAGLLGLCYGIEVGRMTNAQERYAQEFDLVTFVSDVDREIFIRETGLGAEQVVAAPVGVDLEQRPFSAERSGDKVVFIGNLRTLQNRDAVRHFAMEVLPRVRARRPTATVKIVGAVDAAFAAEFSQVEGVCFTGVVPSIADAVSDCCVGVCPVRIAAGLQNKILDYMGLGIPVVTTAYGAEGLRAEDGRHLIVADSTDAFADEVVRLIEDSELRVRLAKQARALVEATYATDVNAERLRAAFRG